MAKHRTPQELLAEALERVAELKAKTLQHQLANHPQMATLITREKEAKKQLSKCSKWLDPEKGLRNRIAKLNQQLAEAHDKLENAETYQTQYHDDLMEIQNEKKALTTALIEEIENQEAEEANG